MGKTASDLGRKGRIVMKKTLRRLGSFLLVLAMLMAIMPAALAADEVTVYLKPSSNWLEGNARFAVYYFNAGDGWVSMTDAGDGFYSANVPAGATVIFCRMNPDNAANGWDNKWNQTADLTLPTDGKDCFFAPAGTWDGAGNENWGTKETAPDVEEPVFTGYTVAGEAGLCGAGWDPAQNAMTETSTGIWEITFTNIPADNYEFKVTDGSWANSWGEGSGNASVTLEAVGDVTITFNADTKEITTSITYTGAEVPDAPDAQYTVAGQTGLCGVEWDPTKNLMTETSEGIWEITFTDIEAGTYEFKVTDGSWGNSWGNGGGNATVELTGVGDVTITFNANTKEITTSVAYAPAEYTVTFHFLPDESWGDTINAWLWKNEGDSIPGYEDYHISWPGKAITPNADHEGWYDLTVVTDDANGFKYIFNDGSNQTADLVTGPLSGNQEIWLVGQTRHDTAPEEWTGVPTYTYTVYYHNTNNWSKVYAYTWGDHGELLGSWAGTQASAVEGNDGWYYITLTVPADEVNLIFNSGDGSQTPDLNVASQKGERKVEAWVEGNDISYTAPDGWNEVQLGNTVKIHFMAPYTSWGDTIYAWLWNGGSDVPGYEEYHKTWPGKKVDVDHSNPGWYYLEVTTELSGFNFIFSGKRQTADLHTGLIDGDMEIWVYGNDIYTYKPDVLPATGDSTNLSMLAGMMILSVLAMGALVIGRKKLV